MLIDTGHCRWKNNATATMERLQDAVEFLLQHNNLPDLGKHRGSVHTLQDTAEHETSVQTLSSFTSPEDPSVRNFTAEGPSAGHGNQDDSDLIPLPMNNLYNLTDPNNSRLIRVDPGDANGPDIISQGVISAAEAEFLFNHFRDHINPLLWNGILCSHKTLQDARESSSFLVAVVLSVAALHIPNRDESLRVTYGAFVSLMRGSCLLRCQNLDIIRALCIGAFYLTSLSWAICSRAVRVATEMNLHKSSLQFARGSLESYERVQLWYVLYVCDHQFALAYGRPPLMHEDAAIRNADKLLTSGLSSKGDRGLVAQVKLFRILANSYFMYGCDPDLELCEQDFEQLQSFNISVDQWRLEHHSQNSVPEAGSLMPAKGNALYYHLARFQMNSVSLRGISGKGSSPGCPKLEMNWERQEAANNAISAAMSTVRLIVNDHSLRKALVGLPIFTHAMIAVCASFLLKMAVVFGEPISGDGKTLRLPRDLAQYGLSFHTKMALTNVRELCHALGLVADNASQRHVARQVVTGLGDLLQRFSADRQAPDTYVYSQPNSSEATAAAPNGLRTTNSSDGAEQTTAQQGNPKAQQPAVDMAVNRGEGMLSDQPEYQQDVFDLTGDLDWRFDDGFLLGIDVIDSDIPFL